MMIAPIFEDNEATVYEYMQHTCNMQTNILVCSTHTYSAAAGTSMGQYILLKGKVWKVSDWVEVFWGN